ncbi:MAG: hypothetical protein AAGE52_19695 [Myxococcota bacterium]
MTQALLALVAGLALWSSAAWSFTSDVNPGDANDSPLVASSAADASDSLDSSAREPVADRSSADDSSNVNGQDVPLVADAEEEDPKVWIAPFARGYVDLEEGAVDFGAVADEIQGRFECHLALTTEIGSAEGTHRASFLATRRHELVRRALIAEGVPSRRILDRGWSLTPGESGRVHIERTESCR